jgi:hypothetical protein
LLEQHNTAQESEKDLAILIIKSEDRKKNLMFHTLCLDKTKYLVMARDQNAGCNHNMKIDNSSIARVEEFLYLGTTLKNQNSSQVEIKSRLKLGNACYYSVLNLLSSRLFPKI